MNQTELEWLEQMQVWQKEELREELTLYVYDIPSLGKCLKHPLVFDVPLTLPGRCNAAYEDKTKALQKALAEEDWFTAVWLHERPYRFEAFVDIVLGRDDDGAVCQLLGTPEDVRDLACDVWTDSENIAQHVEEWQEALSGWEPGMPLLMGDVPGFDALPDELVVWRGDCDDGGWSWSLEESVGRFFAKRFQNRSKNHRLLRGKVSKWDVFGYITSRNEAEILSTLVRDIEEVEL